MQVIDSPANARLRAATGLRERRHRTRTGRTLVDGARESRRALDAGVELDTAFVCRARIRGGDAEAVLAALEGDPRLVELSERAFAALAYGDRREGVVLVVRAPSTTLDELEPISEAPLVLVTEDVEKPGNLGAILRTADAAGCDAVIAIDGADLYGPNVIRASTGAAFTVPMASATPAECLAWLHRHGIRPLAARVDATTSYADVDLRGPTAFVLGSEADGLSAAWADPSILGVRLPMAGVADSLNVSVTAAVLAFEARRQRDLEARGTVRP